MDIVARVNQLVDLFGSTISGSGVTLAGIGAYSIGLLRQLILTVKSMDAAGPEKRALVLQAMGAWYDRVIPSLVIPWPWWLMWLEWLRPYVRPWIRGLLLEAAGEALEAIYSDLKEEGKL